MNRKMVKTNIEWLPEIPETWKCARVKNLFYISKEQAHEKNPTVLSLARSGVKIRDISNNEGQLAESYFNYNVVKPGDLLLNPMDLYSGANCNMSEVSGVISPAYANLRAKTNLNPKYFDYYFKTQYWSMAMFAHGKGVSFDNRWTLNNDGLLSYDIPVPNQVEQNEIVKIIEQKIQKIDSLIKLQETQIENLESFKAQFIASFVYQKCNNKQSKVSVNNFGEIPSDWDIVPLKSLFDFGKGLSITKDNLVDSGEKVISYGQIHSKLNNGVSIDDSLFRFVSKKYLKENPECLVKKHDYIFADTSEDLKGTGDFVHIDRDEKIFAGYHSIILFSKAKFNPYYLSYEFLTDEWRDFFRQRVGGVKLFSLTKKILSQGQVVLPPLELQDQIANVLNDKCAKIDILKKHKQEKIEKLEEYKKSLIYEYINGIKEVATW